MAHTDDAIRVLHVDRDAAVAETVGDRLAAADDRLTVTTATGVDDCIDTLAEGDVDCVVSAQELPDGTGVDLLERVRADAPELPFVLFVEAGSEALARRAISADVTEYLERQEVTEQPAALAGRVREAAERYRRHQEMAERARESTVYERIFQTIQEGACLYDAEGRFEIVNDYLVDFFGTTRESLVGERSQVIERIREEAAGDPYQELLDGDRDLLQGEYRLDLPGQDPDHAVVAYRLTTLEGDDRIEGVVGVARDVTEQKARERELRQSREEYQELFNGMNDTAWVIDLSEEFLAVNDAAVDTLGYSREELLSMSPQDIDEGLSEDEITDLISSMPEDEIQVFETVHRTKDGEEIPVEISSSLISYQDETAVLSIARDISLRREREERLEQFASIVSHDLRNPLNVAQGRVELAREECDSDHLDQVTRAHERMELLISDLLTLAREGKQVSETEPVRLSDLVETCWANVDTDGATLALETDRTIEADRSRLQQLLENLVRNAAEHGGDDVTVTVGDLDDGFYVEDDGPGIPEDRREKVFDTGYSTSDDGTGFGLSIVERVAEGHGWTITLTEGTEGGARFEFTDVTVDS